MRFNMPREFYVPKLPTEVKDYGDGTVSYKYELNGVLYGMMFLGKARKPTWHYRFRSEAARDERIAETLAALTAHKTRNAERRAEKAAFVHTVKVGDLFHRSWGYDQTNNDYFEVTEVKGKYVTVRQLAKAYKETGFMSGNSAPLPGTYLTGCMEFTKRCLVKGGYEGQACIKVGDYPGSNAYFLKPKEQVAGVKVYESHHESSYA